MDAEEQILRRRAVEKVHAALTTSNAGESNMKFGYTGPKESPYSIWNVMWMVTSMAAFYYSDFALVVLYDPTVKRLWLYGGGTLIMVNVVICVFLVVWLTWIKKIPTDQWESLYPAAIPTATASFIIGSIFLMIALWPVYHIFTPVLLFVLFMGFVIFITMIPTSSPPPSSSSTATSSATTQSHVTEQPMTDGERSAKKQT